MAKSQSDAQRWREASPSSVVDVRRNQKRFLSRSAALLALLSCPAWAAKWDIVPTVSVGETYTDNVLLAPDVFKQSDWVTQVTPGISIAATGPQLRFKATYDPEFIYSARGEIGNHVFQHGKAVGNAELSNEVLFLDFGANVNQVDVSLQGPLTTSNVNNTGNRATVETFFVSPYLRHDFGSDVQAEARFTNDVVNSDASSTSLNSVADRINLGLKSGPAYRLLTWNLDYASETIIYGSGQDTSIDVAIASARRLITANVGLLTRVGYEHYNTSGVIVPSSTEGPIWSAGFDWTPTPRTRLSATAGQQLHRDAYSFDFTHRTRLTTWSAGHIQNVTTTRSKFFEPTTTTTEGYLDTLFLAQFPDDPVARQKAVDDYIARTGLPSGLSAPINFFSSELFLVKRWQASVGILGVRNVLIANVFQEVSEALVGNTVQAGAGDFVTSNTIKQTGASLLWNWRLTAQNAWNLGVAYSRNELPEIGRIDNLTYVGMGLTRQFQPRLSGSLNYRRQHNDSNQNAFSYTENAVFATLRLRL